MILDVARIREDDAYRQDMRHRFETDHFFAAEVIGYRDFSARAHGPAVNLYPPKNRNIPIRDQHRKHKFIHLDPRHTFKTSLKRIDRLQWICAFPEEITILNNSATQPLAEAVSNKTALMFYRAKGAPSRPLHELYPELVIDKKPSGQWNTPCRMVGGAGDLDFTLDFTSPKTSQSGWHPLILDYDDVEDTENSGIGVNQDVRQHVIDVCDQNENTLRDGGFIFIGGTRYHPLDWYGKRLEEAKENPEEWGVLVRTSLTVRSGARLVPGEFPDEEDVELHFPEFANLSYRELRTKFMKNYESFMCQQQNDPQGGHVQRFTEAIYNSCQIAPERIPSIGGETFMVWRPRYGGKPCMEKYSEGAVARIIDGRVYVLDAWQGTYTPSGEAEKIVHQAKQHHVDGIMLCYAPGNEFVMAHVRNEALKRNYVPKLQWLEYEEEEGRVTGAIEQIEPLMKAGRVLFSTAMSKAAECRKQFIHFGIVLENGIADSISKFANMVPISQMRANMEEDELEWQRRRRDDGMLSAFLSQQGLPVMDEMVRQQTDAHARAMQVTTSYRMPPLPGGLDG